MKKRFLEWSQLKPKVYWMFETRKPSLEFSGIMNKVFHRYLISGVKIYHRSL